jgi:hypothetical protein
VVAEPRIIPWILSLDVAQAPFTEHELCDVRGAISTRFATACRQQVTDRADFTRHLRVLADSYSIVQLNQGAFKRDQNRRNLAERGDYLTRAPGYRDQFTRQRGILTLGRHVERKRGKPFGRAVHRARHGHSDGSHGRFTRANRRQQMCRETAAKRH